MITTLHIKNVGIIDDVTIDLQKGLNILTGETGAGKTLIIDSLAIIAGGRFSKEMIRRGEDYSFVEMCLCLPEDERAIDGNVILSREITSSGRNLCKINGRMVTVTELKEYMNHVINIHGQNDNQNILNKESHIGYLDAFAGNRMQETKKQYEEKYQIYQNCKKELENCYGDDKERQRKLDLLEYQRREIEEADLQNGEEEELNEKRGKIANAEKIATNLTQAGSEIEEKSLDGIERAIRSLEKIESYSKEYETMLSSLKSVYYDLQEVGRDLSETRQDMSFDKEEREAVENRLDLIHSLKRKYGNTIEEILDYLEEVKQEMDTIYHLEEKRNKLQEQLENIQKEMEKLAGIMHTIRIKTAQELEKQINKQLADLEMKKAKFEVKIEKAEEFKKNGCDNVEFYICTNLGEEAKELIKIASGGEMSRIMLAIKTVLADVDKVPVLVFDEIDTGISGIAANRVGEKLKRIGKNHQVLVITHSGSIAAKGDHNYRIAKEIKEGRTKTNIACLQEPEVLKEIARLTSGEITEISIEHAMALRKAS